MFLTARGLQRLHEQHIEDLKAEHRRTVEVLAEQIEYLRMQLGQPNLTRRPALNPTEQPPMEAGMGPHLSEEEEDILALREAGQLSQLEMEQALARLGFKNPTITSD